MFLEFCTIEALNLRPGSKELEAFNVLECNLGCKKEVIYALDLHPRTVAKAIKIIRSMPIAAIGLPSHDQDHRRALQLSSPVNCHEQTVTTSDFADVSMQSCLMGVPQLAEWMKLHPAERLARWRCVIGKQDGRGA